MKNDYSLAQYLGALNLLSVNTRQFLKVEKGLDPRRAIRATQFKLETFIKNPDTFNLSGLLTFHGSQGFGKTLTACGVYCQQVLDFYPYCILCTNTKFKNRPFNAYIWYQNHTETELREMYEEVKEQRKADYIQAIKDELEEDFLSLNYPEFTVEEYINKRLPFYFWNEDSDYKDFCTSAKFQLRDMMTDELITPEKIKDGTFKNVTVEYWGLDCLKFVNNGDLGVLFFIDEIHLELNSTDRNVPIEIMIEISQQRKQRKHIVDTSQRFKRTAKFLREQTHDCVDCRCFFGVLQYNKLIDGESIDESDSKLTYNVKKRYLFFHDANLYKSYDTYQKMRRYNNEWQGRSAAIAVDSVR